MNWITCTPTHQNARRNYIPESWKDSMGTNCLPLQSSSRRVRKMVRVGASRNKIGAARGKKSKPLRVPLGKIVQAQALLVQGRSQREIARALRISPHFAPRLRGMEILHIRF
jgi:hypothetical protein